MAIGPSLYFNQYKDLSIDKLKKKLKECNSPLNRVYLWFSRLNERRKKIDDNCCVTNNSSEKEALLVLIQFKTRFPQHDLSELTFFEVKKMLTNKKSN